MALDDSDWASIYNAIAEAKSPSEFTHGKVIESDNVRKAVKVAEFGDQWIPMYGFKGTVKYYDETSDGSVVVKTAKFIPDAPAVGDTVLIARQYGTRRLPRCIGVLLSKGL